MIGRSFIPLVGFGPGRAIVSHGLGGVGRPRAGIPCVVIADEAIDDVELCSLPAEDQVGLSDEAVDEVELCGSLAEDQVELSDEVIAGVALTAESCE